MSDEHGRLEYTPAKVPTGVATAAMRGCCLCGEMISGMGGGGDYIHKKCWNQLWSGEVATLKADLDRQTQIASDAQAELAEIKALAREVVLTRKGVESCYSNSPAHVEWRNADRIVHDALAEKLK